MRTVTSICFAAVGGICFAFFLLAVFIATPNLAIPGMAVFLTVVLLAGARSMAKAAGTPILLPLAVFLIFTGIFYWLLSSSW